MKYRGLWRCVALYLLAAATLLTVTALYEIFAVNTATVALSFILIVLAFSLGGFGPAIFSSVVAGLCFNYFFLPPTGKWTIADPQDWLTFITFVTSAFLISGFSSALKRRADEAQARALDISRLEDLSKKLCFSSEADASIFAKHVIDCFDLEYCALYLPTESGMWHRVSAAVIPTVDAVMLDLPANLTTLPNLLQEHEHGVRYISLKNGEQSVAIFAIKPGKLSWGTVNAIAMVVALALGRTPLTLNSRRGLANY
jgi:two-component system, OmpR family, sensor histidine kinase KdpD